MLVCAVDKSETPKRRLALSASPFREGREIDAGELMSSLLAPNWRQLMTVRQQLGSFAHLCKEADGIRNKVALGAYLASTRILPAQLKQRVSRRNVCVGFREFELEFRLSRGELTPYAQIQTDIARGIIPIPERPDNWVIMDCGANIGLFSLFLKNAGYIIAIEPIDECHERLSHNFARNGVRGVAVRKALSDDCGRIRMHLDALTVLSTVSECGQLEVEATTIDAVAREYSASHIDLLKLDVEGHELQVLRGARGMLQERRIHRIYTEYTSPAVLQSLDDSLRPFGFTRVRVSEFNALYELLADA